MTREKYSNEKMNIRNMKEKDNLGKKKTFSITNKKNVENWVKERNIIEKILSEKVTENNKQNFTPENPSSDPLPVVNYISRLKSSFPFFFFYFSYYSYYPFIKTLKQTIFHKIYLRFFSIYYKIHNRNITIIMRKED